MSIHQVLKHDDPMDNKALSAGFWKQAMSNEDCLWSVGLWQVVDTGTFDFSSTSPKSSAAKR